MAYPAPDSPESTDVTEHEAILMLQRYAEIAARVALGDGVSRQMVSIILHTLADAIEDPSSVAEDMSPIVIHMA